MKKISAILCISVSLLLGLASCSKTNVDKKAVFFENFEALVKKAENNSSEERIPEIQSEYDKFFKENSKITSISTWTKEDTEKMEDLKKRFSLSIAPMADFSNLLTDDPLENSDTFIDNTVTDLGLDDTLNFGDSFFSDLTSGLGTDLSTGLNSGLDSTLNLDSNIFGDLTIPDLID